MDRTIEDIARKMDALDLWARVMPYHWAVKPKGTAFPYFCAVRTEKQGPVRVRFLMLEGWCTFHDFIRTHIDPNHGIYSSPVELPHFELLFKADGGFELFRFDTGFVPVPADDRARSLCVRILWEAYGIMLRIEADEHLALSFSETQAMFARVEKSPGEWADAPLAIPPPPKYVEKVAFPRELIRRAKDLAIDREAKIELDFFLDRRIVSRDPRPRLAHRLLAVDSAGVQLVDDKIFVDSAASLKSAWEEMPVQLVRRLVDRGRIPGEIKVRSGRVFRFLRPLCLELPFRLSLHDRLERIGG